MVAQWAWLRNSGVALMVIAVALWVGMPTNVYTWLAALTLWVVGCAMISVAGLAFIHQLVTRAGREETAVRKSKVAAA